MAEKGGWHHDNANWKPKTCPACKCEFTPKSGAHRFCSSKCRGKWKYMSGAASTSKQYLQISGNWRRYFSRLLHAGGKRREELTIDDLASLHEQQGGLCALTGVPLTCELEVGVHRQTNASIDRVEAGGAYSRDNVRLVCSAVNKWRGALPTADFVEWCRKVVTHSERS